VVTSTTTTGVVPIPSTWDLTADVVVIGAGGAGLPAALAAQAAGASVIIVEMNYDVGGHAIVSGGTTDLGGGTSAQKAANIVDSADLVFQDLTSAAATQWSEGSTTGMVGLVALAGWGGVALPSTGAYGTKYQDRALSRVFADNHLAAFNFLVANGMQFSDNQTGGTTAPSTSHWVAPSKIARSNTPMWKGSTSNPAAADSPNGAGGVGYIRPLEITARNK